MAKDTRAIVRTYKNRTSILCHLGHVLDEVKFDKNYAGSRAQANLSAHQAGQETAWDRQSAKCTGAGHEQEELND